MKQRRICNGLLCISLILFSFAGVREVKAAGNPVRLLLVTNSAAANHYGAYLGEILRAEGLDLFDSLDLRVDTLVTLANYPVVILADIPLTAGQATALTDYVHTGGRLIAMSPDAQIASLFGLGTPSGTLNDGYLKIIDTASLGGYLPGQGLPTDTLQIHGGTDQYALAGGTILAKLYSPTNTDTLYPAVVGAQPGLGLAVAFLYDLATNIVYTRQGNPANANSDMDGDGIFRTIDLFQKPGGGASWLSLDKMPLPQADIQQRFFARLVRGLSESAAPLPQLWYFPSKATGMLILTGDSHANPTDFFQTEIDSLAQHHGKITFYVNGGATPTDADLVNWVPLQDSFGIHPYADTTNLAVGYEDAKTWFAGHFPSITMSRTVRNHRLAWAGWTDSADYAAAAAAAHGIAMDFDFYPWGAWLQKSTNGPWAHGFINGSGLPMKFIHQNGRLIDVYQQATHLVDEQLIAGIAIPPKFNENLLGAEAFSISKQLIDVSQAGSYSALTMQLHVDYYNFNEVTSWATQTLDYAYAHNVPIWNADQWLDFTEARHDAEFTNIDWNLTTKQLTFDLVSGSAPGVSLSIILPVAYKNLMLQSIDVDGNQAPYNHFRVNGVDFAQVSVPAGNHSFQADYNTHLADVGVSLNVLPEQVIFNQTHQITYGLSVINYGPEIATNVELFNNLPSQVSLISATSTQGSCSGTTTITCALGDLLSGGSAGVTITVTAPVDYCTLVNSVEVTTSSLDPVAANDAAQANNPVYGLTYLPVVKR